MWACDAITMPMCKCLCTSGIAWRLIHGPSTHQWPLCIVYLNSDPDLAPSAITVVMNTAFASDVKCVWYAFTVTHKCTWTLPLRGNCRASCHQWLCIVSCFPVHSCLTQAAMIPTTQISSWIFRSSFIMGHFCTAVSRIHHIISDILHKYDIYKSTCPYF